MTDAVKLCPREPTQEMLDIARYRFACCQDERYTTDIWRAMYDAAPNAAPAAAPDDGLIAEFDIAAREWERAGNDAELMRVMNEYGDLFSRAASALTAAANTLRTQRPNKVGRRARCGKVQIPARQQVQLASPEPQW